MNAIGIIPARLGATRFPGKPLAKILGIPVFGIVDSNTNPKLIDYPIPANDDSIKTVKLILNYLVDSIGVDSPNSDKDESKYSDKGSE